MSSSQQRRGRQNNVKSWVAQSVERSVGVLMCLIVVVDFQMTEHNGAPSFSVGKQHGREASVVLRSVSLARIRLKTKWTKGAGKKRTASR